ncbi:MAG: AAA family ATPase [Candidatus Coatesbacteria bacterium]
MRLELPVNAEAERCALGGMLLGTQESLEAIDRVRARLRPRDFYASSHRVIYAAVLALRDRGQCVTSVTVIEELRGQGMLDQAGGLSCVSGLLDEGALACNVDGHAQVILDKAIRREVVLAAHQIIEREISASLPSVELLAAAQHRLSEIGEEFEWVQSTALQLVRPSELSARRVEFLIEPFLPLGQVVVLSGKDKLGKTLLALEMGRAVLKGIPLFGRFAAMQGQVLALLLDDPASLTRDRLEALGVTDEDPITLGAPTTANVGRPDFFVRLEREAQRLSPRLIIVDALYCFLPGSADALNDAARMAPIMQRFNRLAEKTGACVLVVTHDAKSGVDVAGSFAIRAAAKAILRLSRPEGNGREDGECASRDSRRLLSLESKVVTRSSWALDLHGPGDWTFVGTSAECRSRDKGQQVLAYLEGSGRGSAEEIARAIGGRTGEVRTVLQQLAGEGRAQAISEPSQGGRGGRPRQVWVAGVSVPPREENVGRKLRPQEGGRP